MPGLHATLSPSAASRWLSCPASVRVAQAIPSGPDSPYAREGTLAHALAEIEAGYHFGLTTPADRDLAYEAWRASAGLTIDQIGDMAAHVKTYIELIEERLAEQPHSQLLLEQRMDTGVGDGACWGTSDTVIVSPSHVEIIDLKYGMGLPVSATKNPQLRLYALGALDTFGHLLGETEYVQMTISQPRLNSVTTERLSVLELLAWRESIRPVADQALNDPDAPFGPSETACRWCPAAGECRERVKKLAGMDFGRDPDLLTPEEIAELLPTLPEMKHFVEAVGEAALRRAYSQKEDIPGWKVVLSGGRRSITDADGAMGALRKEGFVEEQFLAKQDPKLKGLGDLTKLVNGAKRFQEVLGPFVTKGEGKPALVPEDDKRAAVDPNSRAAADFSESTE